MGKCVMVVDDHPLFNKALVHLASELPGCDSVVSAASAEEGISKVREKQPDLIVMDLGLPRAAGVEAVELLARSCRAMIVAVSATEDRHEVGGVIRAGASVVVSKTVSLDVLKDVVERALAGTLSGEAWIRPAGSLAIADDDGPGLTSRQQEIAALLKDGHSNKEIGMRLGLAEITVKTHLTTIFRLLGVVNRTQAVVAMRRIGLNGETPRGRS